ncbi:hypothetical protein H0H93_001944 [Arthromyces matolae]|nr:hypothetical protein H0H93_001944 [Arthromyces matolae]
MATKHCRYFVRDILEPSRLHLFSWYSTRKLAGTFASVYGHLTSTPTLVAKSKEPFGIISIVGNGAGGSRHDDGFSVWIGTFFGDAISWDLSLNLLSSCSTWCWFDDEHHTIGLILASLKFRHRRLHCSHMSLLKPPTIPTFPPHPSHMSWKKGANPPD